MESRATSMYFWPKTQELEVNHEQVNYYRATAMNYFVRHSSYFIGLLHMNAVGVEGGTSIADRVAKYPWYSEAVDCLQWNN